MDFPAHPDALIVGAGPIGLAAGISARRRGLEPLIIDAGPICNSIVNYPVGMEFFTTPERLEIGDHPLPSVGNKVRREEALAYYRGVVRTEGLDVRTGVRLRGIAQVNGEHHASVEGRDGAAVIRTPRVVLATGYFDHANLLDVPGEELPHVHHRFVEPHVLSGLDVVVVGGKNSAIESALQAWRAGARVTLVHRGTGLGPSVKYWLRPDFENRVAAGSIRAEFGTIVTEITPRTVTVAGHGASRRLPADAVFLLTGYHPDFALLESIGIALDPESGRAIRDPHTLESNVPGIHLAGSVASGRKTSEVFIENGRYDGEKIFGDSASRVRADARYAASPRPRGE
ncbi:MAG TPA: YpdA family putative bacillithiol disulfide reductase [Gemmatimonadales bacterium]|nr:YpdA family putative bacillithiol disulfide reductase [Gemmatimonadales bacterium]